MMRLHQGSKTIPVAPKIRETRAPNHFSLRIPPIYKYESPRTLFLPHSLSKPFLKSPTLSFLSIWLIEYAQWWRNFLFISGIYHRHINFLSNFLSHKPHLLQWLTHYFGSPNKIIPIDPHSNTQLLFYNP